MNRRESLRLILGSAALAATTPVAAFAQAQPAAPAQPAATPEEGPFKLPPLGYAFDALEPHIDAQTMMPSTRSSRTSTRRP
jgi:Fe-Mn family superoxide dismutase